MNEQQVPDTADSKEPRELTAAERAQVEREMAEDEATVRAAAIALAT